ncbi:hypothetical protein BKA63DRAFT_5696 [Paraphoma chrysanthemicola]|nr:hypothetical protein BKA63DRAFT_5696 [Paraphoma chrysanthemicola]
MFQTPPSKIGNVMQTTSHLSAPQTTSVPETPEVGTLSSACEGSDNMRTDTQCSESSSGTTTPVSTRSSISYETSNSSTSGSTRPKRSSMKPSLKPAEGGILNRKSSPAAVRFADPEPPSRPRPSPVQEQISNQSQRNGVPNPLLKYQHRPTSSLSSSAPSRSSIGPQAYSTLPPRGLPTPLPGHIQNTRTRVGQRYSAPPQPSRSQPRWSGVPLPTNFTPPSVALEHRVSSFQSVASVASVQSAPAALQHPPKTTPLGKYNPLDHYIPCLYAECTVHYSHSFAYYLPQGPYSLRKSHGYCNYHATHELKTSNALCKQKWESLRQNAGRQTLGQIAADFDDYMQSFRKARAVRDAELVSSQKRIVIGAPNTPPRPQTKQQVDKDADADWNWIYSPRPCTRASCPPSSSTHTYSPFSTATFAFYHTPRESTFTPLSTLCPSCATTEVEAFERLVAEKWGSRCGWDEGEWGEWLGGMVRERKAEGKFWERAQERVAREARAKKREGAGGQGVVKEAREVKGKETEKMKPQVKKDGGEKEGSEEGQKKKGIFRRMFGAKKGGS